MQHQGPNGIDFVRWPEKNYIICERFGFIYIPIEKVACSALKAWVIELIEGKAPPASVDVHRHTRAHYAIRHLGQRRANAKLNDLQLIRFAFVRNPWDRLVSAYLNKFVSWKSPADRFIREASAAVWRRQLASRFIWRRAASQSQHLRWPEVKNALTFRAFVELLSQMNTARFDFHWRPQSMFLGRRDPDFVGRFEHLEEDFGSLCRRIGLVCPLRTANQTKRRTDGMECLADWPLEQLRAFAHYPSFAAFYTADMVDAVATIYRSDIERFQYEFNGELPESSSSRAAG